MARSIYLIGALKNRGIMDLAQRIRAHGHEVWDQWQTPGPEADSFLLEYAKKRGWSYKEALKSDAALHIFKLDEHHINRCTTGILVMPGGKSAHAELGVMHGQGKETFILFDEEPSRFDLMYNFFTDVFFNEQELIGRLNEPRGSQVA